MAGQLPNQVSTLSPQSVVASAKSTSIEWFHEGQTRVVEVDGVRVTVRFIGRKGRRARILIEAPGGAEFRTVDAKQDNVRAPLDRYD